MRLWAAADAADATGGKAQGDWLASGVSIDTRTVRPGDLFVALTDIRDGHDFVGQALEKGAAAAMVSHIPDNVTDDAPLLIVQDVLSALESLGRAGRARMNGKVIAITGSVGKTSTKDMAVAALSGQGRIHAAEASYNNHWGVPLTLARMPPDTDFAVIEIGMSNPGEIEPLARMARPHVALITTIAPAHLEAFGVIEGIAREKGSIFQGLEAPGTAIIPEDLSVTQILRDCADAAGAIVVGFGQDGSARLIQSSPVGERLKCRARVAGVVVEFNLQTTGRHFAMNAVGVLAAIAAAGADATKAAQYIGNWHPPKGRGAIEQLGDILLIDDAFNANPASLRAGLAMLAALQGGRRVAILGDMLELGADEAVLHRDVANDPAMQAVQLVHAAGPLMKNLYEALPSEKRGLWTENSSDMVARAAELVAPGDIVLVKGSKSSKVSMVVDALRHSGLVPGPQDKG